MTLGIGDKLYRYVPLKGCFEYEVFGVRIYKNSSNHYEVRCNMCSHGYKCEVLIKQEGNKFLYIDMLNEQEDYKQYYWHHDTPYFLTEEEALIHISEQHLSNKWSSIDKLKTKLEAEEKDYQDIKICIENLVKKLKEKQS